MNALNRQIKQETIIPGEVKGPRRVLPICANLQKIRDEDGVWNMVEQCIENSDFKFTHSICQDCIRELYPDLADRILAKMDQE